MFRHCPRTTPWSGRCFIRALHSFSVSLGQSSLLSYPMRVSYLPPWNMSPAYGLVQKSRMYLSCHEICQAPGGHRGACFLAERTLHIVNFELSFSHSNTVKRVTVWMCRPIITWNGAEALNRKRRWLFYNNKGQRKSNDSILTEKILETATALIEFIPIIYDSDIERTIKRMVNIWRQLWIGKLHAI